MGARTLRSSLACLAAVMAVALGGCASTRETVGGWFGEESHEPVAKDASAPGTSAYYAKSEGLKVYGSPTTSAAVVGSLSLHEKVMRSKVQGGYAYVESANRNLKGWVDNAQLIWRLPSASVAAPTAQPAEPGAQPSVETEPEAPAAAEQQPEEPAAAAIAEPPPEAQSPPTAANTEPAPAQAPAPAEPAGDKAPPSGSEPSVFDAY